MARLPQPGSDNGTWGDILNEFLSQSLAPSGELKPDSVGSAQLKENSVTNNAIAPNTITNTELASNAVNAAIIADGSITETLLDSSLQTKINASAAVSSVNTKTGAVMLDKTDIGLGNVDNTSDVNKPVSNAQQTALDTKLDKASGTQRVYIVNAAGTQTTAQYSPTAVAGTFVTRDASGRIAAVDPSASSDVTTKNYVDTALASKANDSSVVHTSGNETIANQKTFTGNVIVGDGTANVGITTNGTAYNGVFTNVYSDTASPYSLFTRYKGTIAAPTQVPSGSYLGQFGFRGANETGVANIHDAVRIGAWTEEDVKSTSQQSALIVWTAPNYQISPIERLRVSGNGNVSVGRGADNGSLFSVARNGGAFRMGSVQTNGTTTLTGTGTTFTNTFRVGDSISVAGETSRVITAIASDTSLTVSVAFATSASGLGYFPTSNLDMFRIQTNGNIGINQSLPQARLHFGASTTANDGIQFGTDTNLYRSAADTLRTDDTLSVGTSLVLPQNATTVLYNTSDQTTNYERARHYWSSNTYTIGTEVGGTGTVRNLELKANGVVFRMRPGGSTSGLWEFASGLTSANNVGVNISGSYTATSGVNPIMAIQPTINQSTTAGYTALLVNPTETTTGSGTKLLADFQVGGVSKAKIDNTGSQTLSFGAASSIYNTTDETTNYERVRQFWTGNTYYIRTEAGGTGTQRPIVISGTNRNFTIGYGLNFYDFNTSTGSNSGVTGMNINGSWGSSAAVTTAMSITPSINQSGTAGYTMLQINPTETSTGSGTKLLADFQVGGVSKTRIDTLGSHLLSGGAKLVIFNTTDETTNYERAALYWSSNAMNLRTEFGGTGLSRNLILGTANRTMIIADSPGASGIFQFTIATSTTNSVGVGLNGSIAQSSATYTPLAIQPTVNQSGTAGYTALLINPTESTTGSGTKLLADFQVGGVSKAKIDNTGVITAAAGTTAGSVVTIDGAQTLTNKTFSAMSLSGNTVLPQSAQLHLYNTIDQTTNYERVRQYWSSNTYVITTEFGGTGTARPMQIVGAGRVLDIGKTTAHFDFQSSTAANISVVRITPTLTTTSGSVQALGITPTINQSGLAGYTTFLVNPTETATGSGTKLLADFQVGGISKVSITSLGQLKLTASTTSASTMNIPTGIAPSSPSTGDIYSDGTHVYCYLDGIWKQLD